MATIKSFTSLEQSKKLAKILPIESADMNYWCGTQIRIGGHRTMDKDLDVPCWSLAALLDVLPQIIDFKGDKYYLRFMKEYLEYANDEVSITGICLHTTGNDNLVDACYEMILKLHEQNLI